MNAKFAKVLALVMMLALVLSGCNLIEIDAKMQADEDIAKINERYSKVVASYDGGEITAGEVMGDFNNYYNEMAYMYYYYFGYDVTQEDIDMIMEDTLTERVRAEVVSAKFDENYTLTEEEIASMEEEVQLTYDENLASAIESAEGDRDDQKQEYARVILREYGMDYDSIYNSALLNTKTTRMEEILREEISDVTEEELRAVYEEKVTEQMDYYTDGSSLESAMSGTDEIVCWMPEGYRTVKHILVTPDETTATAYSSALSNLADAQSELEMLQDELIAANDDDLAEGERTPEEIQTEIDALNAGMGDLQLAATTGEQLMLLSVSDTTDEIYARLQAGEDFEALIAEYGQDPGMQNEPTMSRGYYVSEASVQWEENFRDAAMQLANVGDYTTRPVASGSGVHIIQYTADVPAGEVAFETVREDLRAEALESARDAHAEETIAAWVEAVNASYDVAAFESTFTVED